MANVKCSYCYFYEEQSVVTSHEDSIHKDSEGNVIEKTVVVDPPITLEEKKNIKKGDITQKTEESIELGLIYNGHRFSVSSNAKPNWIALVMIKDSLPYPYAAPTGFDEEYNFQSALDVLGFFDAGMYFIQYWEQSNEQFNIIINACTTVAEVDAIIDNRHIVPARAALVAPEATISGN